MKSFKQFLGPEATKQQDSQEISRQKQHLANKAKEYKDQSTREGGSGAAFAKGVTFDLAKTGYQKGIIRSIRWDPIEDAPQGVLVQVESIEARK